MSDKHTPTPWEHWPCDADHAYPLVIGADDKAIAQTLNNEDAAHIAHCANVHEDLVRALEMLIDAHDSPDTHETMSGQQWPYARKALAAAKRES